MSNPYFVAVMSSDEIYFGQDVTTCITDVVNDKADADHAHDGYAEANHTHDSYALQTDLELLEDVVDTKANVTHIHSEYAESTHSHSDYATQIALDTLETEVDGKADVSHTHTDYATSSHTHSEYATYGHDHDEDYAAIDHTHSDYATTTALNEVSATVSNKANASHSHDDMYYTETEIDTKLSSKSDTSHTHTGVYDASGSAASALTSANAYTDSKIDALVGEGASTTLDTIGEISSAIEDNQDAINLLNSAIANKANTTDLTSHTGNTNIHVTSTDKDNWDIAKTHADSAHAPSNAEVNQNAFSNITVGDTTISADTKTDTLTLIAGSNVTLTPNADGDSVTIAATNTVYTHPTTAGNKHIPAGGSSGQILRWSADGTATWGADNNTTYSVVTQTVNGLMSADDKGKLDSIAENANNYTLPSAGTSLGGVMTGGDVTISSGVITVNDDSHNHVISNVDGLQDALDAKAASSHNHDSVYYTETEVDTLLSSKANTSHTHAISNITNLQSALDAKTNQNAFSYVKVGDVSVAADTTTDTLTLVAGTNVTITPDATNDKITISATDTNTTYSAGTGISLSGTTFSNSGVRSISTGSSNGTISVNTNGTSANVAVKGLGSAAYTASTAYDAVGTAQTKADAALASAKAYTDSVKSDLLNGAGSAYDTLKELGDLIDVNVDAIDALETVAASKASASDLTSHTSNKSNPHGVTLAQLGVTATASELNKMDGITATTAELNIMDGITATTAELNYVDGVTSNIQTQLDGKAASSHTHSAATTSTAGFMSASDKSKLDGIAAGANAYTLPTASSSTLGGVKTTSTVTSNSGYTACPIISGVPYYKDTNTTYSLSSFGVTATAAELNALNGITATVTELNYMDGVTANVQTQLNAKAASSHTHSYAGSSSAGGAATSANKLNTNAGSATQPVYFANGIPVATTYTLGASVPSGAKFTDTTYGAVTTSANGLMIASDKSKLDGMVLANVSEVETYLAI